MDIYSRYEIGIKKYGIKYGSCSNPFPHTPQHDPQPNRQKQQQQIKWGARKGKFLVWNM